MNKKCIALLLLCFAGHAYAGLLVPNAPVKIKLPDNRVAFDVRNSGKQAIVAELDLADRGNVYQAAETTKVILYPKTMRLAPGESRRVSVTWRGGTEVSQYYFVRARSLTEAQVAKDRSNPAEPGLQVQVGQAFPLNIEVPGAKASVIVKRRAGALWVSNEGGGADHIEKISLHNGRKASLRKFLLPGESVKLNGIPEDAKIVAIKLRRGGWVGFGAGV